MSRALEEIARAIEHALHEVAAAEELALIPDQAERHWLQAICCFARCMEVCGGEREEARARVRRGQ